MNKKIILVIMLCVSVFITSGCGCGKKADKKLLCNYKNEKTGDITELTVYFKKDKAFKQKYNITYNFESEEKAKEYYNNRKLDMTGINDLKLDSEKVLMETYVEINNENRNFEGMKKELESQGFVCK